MILSLIRQHPRLAAAIGAALVLIGVVVVGGLVLAVRYFAPPPQPLVFNHNQHVAAGATCLYCHAGATRGAVAGLPSTVKCMGCHTNVTPKNPADQKDIDQLVAYWDEEGTHRVGAGHIDGGLRAVQAPPAHGCRRQLRDLPRRRLSDGLMRSPIT